MATKAWFVYHRDVNYNRPETLIFLRMVTMCYCHRFLLGALLLIGLLGMAGCATLQEAFPGVVDNLPLDEQTVTAGLKQALQVGTERTVAATGQEDGFLGNSLIRIPIPDQLTDVTGTLRSVGLGSYVDELEVGMNRAAEQAAGEAVDVFWDAITRMTVADAFAILEGADNAATEYFRSRTWETLSGRFQPIVQDKMDGVGLAQVYDQVLDLYGSLPLMDKPELVPLDTYVTDKALGGLFTVLAGEEKKIREDPLARSTDLLRRVFGSQD